MEPLIREADMPAAHSDDLRERVVAAVAAGASRRQAAARFQVGVSSAIRWTTLEKATGSVSPKPGRGSRSPLEAHAAWLKALVGQEPFLTLAEVVARFADELEVTTSQSAVRRFFQRHRISVKKNRARQRT
jgi:transposase